jgi:hypothetical protein
MCCEESVGKQKDSNVEFQNHISYIAIFFRILPGETNSIRGFAFFVVLSNRSVDSAGRNSKIEKATAIKQGIATLLLDAIGPNP